MSATSASLLTVGAGLPPTGTPGSYGPQGLGELAVMARAGLGAVRLYVPWAAVEPQVGRYEDDALDDLARTVAESTRLGLAVTVCLFAELGDGRLLDVAWAGRRDPRTDPYMLDRGAALVSAVASRLAGQDGLAAWQLADEGFLAGFPDAAALAAWAATVTEALRDRDPDRPVSLGADTEALLETSGLDAREAADALSLATAAPTARAVAIVAPGPGSAGPGTHLAGFFGRLTGRALPVAADEALPATTDRSVGELAGALRMGLYDALADGVATVWTGPWRVAATPRRVPFFRARGESLTGLLDADGRSTPALGEVTSFTALTAALAGGPLEPARERVAVLLPSSRYGAGPLGTIALRSSLAAFSLARQAHVPVDVLREGDPLDGLAVLVVPSPRALPEETWAAVAAYVTEGGTLVTSHGGAEPPDALRTLVGVEYLGESGPRETLACRIAQPLALGSLSSFEVALRVPASALLAPGRATVIAADGTGRPLVTVFRAGRGRTYFVSAAIERAIGDLPHDEVPTNAGALLSAVYRAAAEAAGAAGPVDCDRRSVRTAVLTSDDGPVLVLVNHAAVRVTTTVTWERRVASITPAGGTAVPVAGTSFRVPLAAHGGAVLAIQEA